jgi:hypothetical protein
MDPGARAPIAPDQPHGVRHGGESARTSGSVRRQKSEAKSHRQLTSSLSESSGAGDLTAILDPGLGCQGEIHLR